MLTRLRIEFNWEMKEEKYLTNLSRYLDTVTEEDNDLLSLFCLSGDLSCNRSLELPCLSIDLDLLECLSFGWFVLTIDPILVLSSGERSFVLSFVGLSLDLDLDRSLVLAPREL